MAKNQSQEMRKQIEDCICPGCKHIIKAECPPAYCEEDMHVDYEPVTECEKFARKTGEVKNG